MEENVTTIGSNFVGSSILLGSALVAFALMALMFLATDVAQHHGIKIAGATKFGGFMVLTLGGIVIGLATTHM